jgi:hypothetical protein
MLVPASCTPGGETTAAVVQAALRELGKPRTRSRNTLAGLDKVGRLIEPRPRTASPQSAWLLRND